MYERTTCSTCTVNTQVLNELHYNKTWKNSLYGGITTSPSETNKKTKLTAYVEMFLLCERLVTQRALEGADPGM